MEKTPYYFVDYKKFRNNCMDVMQAFENEWGSNLIFGYSVKTNRYEGLIKYAYNELGWYAETVSPDEYNYCLRLNIDSSKVILNGPCKRKIINSAFENGTYLNLDNLDEVIELCKCSQIKDNVRVGLRVNFDLESICPGETTAGQSVSRFGIDCHSDDFKTAIELLKEHGLTKVGLHMHMSTKTRSLNVFQALAEQTVNLIGEYNMDVPFIDMGGGFFGGQIVEGKPSMKEYAKRICSTLKKKIKPDKTTLILEPGASVLATSVSYVTKVINTRKVRDVNIITLDGTMLHVNPFMSKRNQPFIANIDKERHCVDKQILCGCTCMENDRFGELEYKVELRVGDELIFKNVGAYTMAFNSHFIIEPPQIKSSREERWNLK